MQIILNRTDLKAMNKNSESFHFALSAAETAIRSADPYRLMKKHIKSKGDNVTITDLFGKHVTIDLSGVRRIYVVGAGKASGKMASGVHRILGNRIFEGAVNVPYDSNMQSDLISIHEAGHPIPDENGIVGTKKILRILSRATKNDLVIVLLSGGGSALLPMPLQGISLSTKQLVTSSLLLAGASIEEVNTVRKHLSAVKGGRLLNYISMGCMVVSIIISDVIGDDLSTIASGPTFPDSSTFMQAKEILKKYEVWNSTVAGIAIVKKTITNGIIGRIPETIKTGDRVLANVNNIIVGNNEVACKAAIKLLKENGLSAIYLGSSFDGSAVNHGRYLANLANQISSYCLPLAFVLGGETVVKVDKYHRHAIGGRNLEAALSSALSLKYKKNMDVSICCVGTDGIDGNSNYAGAFVTPRAFRRVMTEKEKYEEYLNRHDSGSAFRELKSLIVTGRTGTNVNDISIIVRAR